MQGQVLTTKEAIYLAIEAAAKTAIEKWREEEEKQKDEQRDWRLRNTKLLLKNYRLFHEHLKNAIWDQEQLCAESPIEILELMNVRHGLKVESIANSLVRTKIIMKHVDEMLMIYKIYCEKSGKPEEQRRYRVIKKLYLDEKALTAADIAEEEDIDLRTVYKDVNAACDKLSALLFGIDSLC